MDVVITITTAGWGGMEAYATRLASGLHARGHDVAIACPTHSIVYDEAGRRGIKVLALPGPRVNPVATMSRLVGHLRSRRPQLIHGNSGREYWPVILSAALTRTAVILTRHLTQPVKPFTRALINARVARIIVPSRATREGMQASGVDEMKLRLVYHGIDASPVIASSRPSRFRRDRGIEDGAPLIGIVSNLHGPHGKGHDTILRSIPFVRARHPSCRWVIVGDGPLKPALLKSAQDLGVADRVLFAGQVSPERIPDILAGLDLFILLPQDQEVLSYAVLEAMAAALPVITSTVGGAKELVVDGLTGYVIEPQDHGALGRLTADLLASPSLRTQLGRAGQKRAAVEFGMDRFLRETEAVYAEVLQRRGHG